MRYEILTHLIGKEKFYSLKIYCIADVKEIGYMETAKKSKIMKKISEYFKENKNV